MQVFANQQRAAQEKHNMKGEDSTSRDVSKRGAQKRQKLSQDSSKTISRYLDDDGEDLNASDLQDQRIYLEDNDWSMASIVSSCPLTANNSQDNVTIEKKKAKDAEQK